MSIREAYNVWSEVYDSNLNKTRDLDLVVSKKLLSERSFKNILEIGCGTGKNTEWLTEICDKITSVDFSENMFEIAKSKIKSPKVTFIQADINMGWNFTDEKFDLIMFNLVLEHIENLEHIFNQANQKISENGEIFISELHPFRQYIGSKAKFEINNQLTELKVFVHNISEFFEVAQKFQFNCNSLKEWKSAEEEKDFPRLISFIFMKDI